MIPRWSTIYDITFLPWSSAFGVDVDDSSLSIFMSITLILCILNCMDISIIWRHGSHLGWTIGRGRFDGYQRIFKQFLNRFFGRDGKQKAHSIQHNIVLVMIPHVGNVFSPAYPAWSWCWISTPFQGLQF